jgi:hypothetical protein
MADTSDTYSLLGGELVDDAVGAQAQGPEASQSAAEGVPGVGLTRE